MSTPQDPYAPFRSVRGALVARVGAVASVLIFGAIAVLRPSGSGAEAGAADPVALLDRSLVAGLGLLMAAVLWRYARVRAVPDRDGLLVVNLVQSRRIPWTQILRVSFSGGSAWAVLELTDTDEVAVMAIQRADGDRAQQQAARLAALVEHHHR